MNRDPIDVAEEAVAAALTGGDWEVRDDYPYPTGKCLSWIERGVGADCERFIEGALEPEDACKIELLLELARKAARWQDEHTATWERLSPSVRQIYMREYTAVCAAAEAADKYAGEDHAPWRDPRP